MSDEPENQNRQGDDDTTLDDVRQLGMWAALASLGYVFWVVGGMEMIERLAYYGVRAVATIYATRPQSGGGLGRDHGFVRLATLVLEPHSVAAFRYSPVDSPTVMATSGRFSPPRS